MDCEKLISLIQERKCLWDPKDCHYNHRVANRKLWCEVAKLLNSTSAVIKVKWQRLRDMHRREIKKSNLATSSQTRTQGNSTWRFFNHMSFLEDTYARKAVVGNIPDTHKESEIDIIDVELEETDKEVHNRSSLRKKAKLAKDPCDETDKEVHNRSSLPKKAKLAKDPCDEIIRNNKAKLEHLQPLREDTHDNKENDDYFFCMSLLPYLRDVPKHKKLQARMRLLQIVIEETGNAEYKLDSSSSK